MKKSTNLLLVLLVVVSTAWVAQAQDHKSSKDWSPVVVNLGTNRAGTNCLAVGPSSEIVKNSFNFGSKTKEEWEHLGKEEQIFQFSKVMICIDSGLANVPSQRDVQMNVHIRNSGGSYIDLTQKGAVQDMLKEIFVITEGMEDVSIKIDDYTIFSQEIDVLYIILMDKWDSWER